VAGLAQRLGEALDAPRRTRPTTPELVASRFGPDAVRDQYLALYRHLVG
jgi:hypothetical protein